MVIVMVIVMMMVMVMDSLGKDPAEASARSLRRWRSCKKAENAISGGSFSGATMEEFKRKYGANRVNRAILDFSSPKARPPAMQLKCTMMYNVQLACAILFGAAFYGQSKNRETSS